MRDALEAKYEFSKSPYKTTISRLLRMTAKFPTKWSKANLPNLLFYIGFRGVLYVLRTHPQGAHLSKISKSLNSEQSWLVK